MIPSLHGRDLPSGGYYRYFEQYSDEQDTPQNRAALVEQMTDAATGGLVVSAEAMAALRKAIGGWLDAQDGERVLAWMTVEGIAPDYETWVAS